MRKRTDVPEEALRSSSGVAIATDWAGRLAAVVSIVLFVLVMMAVQKGLAVQQSARQVVQDFHTANDFFAERADFEAAAKAKEQLQRLSGVLGRLNGAAATDVDALAATLPDVADLVAAGRGDVAVAEQLRGVATTLQGSAGSLNQIATDARTSVSQVNSDVAKAIDLVSELNAQLAVTERKLSLLPSTGR